MPRKPKAPPQRTKAKKRKTRPSGDAWPASALGRRQVLKGVVAGSSVVASAMSLPKGWTKPVIQSVVASAQAQVSPPVPLAPLSPAAPPTVLAPTMAPTAPPTMAPTANRGPIGP